MYRVTASSSFLIADIQVEDYYPTFLSMAKNYMEGNIDGATYEDTCREMFGVHAYLAFTLDRLVQNIVRQVYCVCEICFGDVNMEIL